MYRRRLQLSFAFTMAASVAAAGCGKPEQPGVINVRAAGDLRALGVAYHEHAKAKGGVGPANADELRPYCKDCPDEFAKVQAGQTVLIWRVKISEGGTATPGLAATVLGYGVNVPKIGGSVLMGDASVRAMNVQQFQSTPKATPAKKS